MFICLFLFQQQKLIQKPIIKSDMETQTDTHILEYNIVKSYEWNEWELRRKALKMVISLLCFLSIVWTTMTFSNIPAFFIYLNQ